MRCDHSWSDASGSVDICRYCGAQELKYVRWVSCPVLRLYVPVWQHEHCRHSTLSEGEDCRHCRR